MMQTFNTKTSNINNVFKRKSGIKKRKKKRVIKKFGFKQVFQLDLHPLKKKKIPKYFTTNNNLIKYKDSEKKKQVDPEITEKEKRQIIKNLKKGKFLLKYKGNGNNKLKNKIRHLQHLQYVKSSKEKIKKSRKRSLHRLCTHQEKIKENWKKRKLARNHSF